MSNQFHPGAQGMDVQSLLETVRRLELENRRLKEKPASVEALIIERSVSIPIVQNGQNAQKQKLLSQVVQIEGGMKLVLHAEINKSLQIQLSCEVQSTVDMDVTIIMTPDSHDAYGNKVAETAAVDFLRASAQATRGTKHTVNFPQRGYHHNQTSSLNVRVKIVRIPQANSSPFDNNATATVVIQNQKINVDVPYVSKWSQFLQGYFASNMKERATGIYPINDCSLADFREMLEVIYPSSKPIDENNVEAMLNLGDRFIMPMLTRKCEVFLSKKDLHEISEIRMIGMADRFNLITTRTIVLERLGTTALLRSKIIQAAGYDTLSREMKIEIDARYVQLDVQEKEGTKGRGY